MKTIKLCIYLFAVFGINSLFAQEDLGFEFILPQFEKGYVYFKNGTRTPALLNYSMYRQEMLFMDNENTMMEFANLSDIHSILIGERRFFPAPPKRIFYEEIKTESGSFFVQYNAYIISQGKEAAYGGYSQTISTQSLASIENGPAGRVKLKSSEKFGIKTDEYYYIKSGNNYKRFFSAKSLGKLFKGQAAKIEEFAKEQSIDFSQFDDIAKIVEYAYSLMKN